MANTDTNATVADLRDALPDVGRVFHPLHSIERQAARAEQANAETDQDVVSPWLYLAGLCVTLSGLYAVSYGRENPAFATITYVIAASGYAISYFVRLLKSPYESLRLPFLVLVGLGLFAWLSTGGADGGGDTRSALTDRSHAMQLLCMWVALLQPFAAASDMAVLSSCVPCMSLIALVSSTSPDSEVQYAFLVFVGAATFLMVHENYLRTRTAAIAVGANHTARNLFGGQLKLAAGCVICAFMLANVVAVPMQAFGHSLSLANGWGQAGNLNPGPKSAATGLQAFDSQVLSIGTGPQAEDDTPVMRVEAPRALNWRGNTFDYYTGSSFENRQKTPRRLDGIEDTSDLKSMETYHPIGANSASPKLTQYNVTPDLFPAEPPPNAMVGGQTIRQTVTQLGAGSKQCFAAGFPLYVQVPRDQDPLVSYQSESVFTTGFLPANTKYVVVSRIPTEDESVLRSAPNTLSDDYLAVQQRYFQRGVPGREDNPKLRELARQITSGLKNNYDKAVAIRTYIAQNCKYNLQAPADPSDADRVEYFLTVSHQGYCDSFAAAMTILCRYADIPARVATGYISGQPDEKGGYLVRQKDKHAWTEVFFSGAGWVPFDATDGSEDVSDHTVHQRTQRTNFMAWLFSHGVLPPLMLAAIALLLVYVAWTEIVPRLRGTAQNRAVDSRPATNLQVVAAYLQACSVLEKRGLVRQRATTPSEFLAAMRNNLATASPPAAEAFSALTTLHDRYRYGKEAATEDEAREALELAATLKSSLVRISARTLAARTAAQTA